jgi:hypothetical protein
MKKTRSKKSRDTVPLSYPTMFVIPLLSTTKLRFLVGEVLGKVFPVNRPNQIGTKLQIYRENTRGSLEYSRDLN